MSITPITPVDLSRAEYLNAVDAATHYRFPSVAAFRQWTYRHGIVPCRAGRSVRYLKVDLDNQLQGNRRAVLRSRALRSA
jgi:hypothetical protein